MLSKHASALLPSTSLRVLLAVLALSLPALAAAAGPPNNDAHLHHGNSLAQRHHDHHHHALVKRSSLIADAYRDAGEDYHRIRLMPRQSNAGTGDGSSEDQGGGDANGTPLASGRGGAGGASSTGAGAAASNTANGGNNNGGANSAATSNTANNAAGGGNGANTATSQSSASSTTGGGNLLGGLGSGISSALNPSPSTTDVVVTTSTIDSLPPTSSSEPTSAPADTSSDTAAQSSTSADVDNTTITQTVPAETTSDTSAVPEETAEAASEKKDEDKSSGISKSAIIIVIVVASCVGGAIAIWTIIRKVKLSPSSRFNRKLAPIDFSANRRDSDYFGTLGSVDNLASGTHSPPNGYNTDKDVDAWPLHHSPSQSSHGHGRQDSNEKIGGGMYGAIAPALPPSSSAGSLRRNPTMASSNGGAAGLNRADSMALSARGGAMSDSGHQANTYQGFYPAMPPVHAPPPQIGQVYGGAPYHQSQEYGQEYGYAPQYQQHPHQAGLDYSNSMRRPGPGGYEY